MASLRVILQSALKHSDHFLDVEGFDDILKVKLVPFYKKITEVGSTLQETLTLHIMNDKIAEGCLKSLDKDEINGLCLFLFPQG